MPWTNANGMAVNDTSFTTGNILWRGATVACIITPNFEQYSETVSSNPGPLQHSQKVSSVEVFLRLFSHAAFERRST